VVLTLAAVLASREPSAGPAYRWVLAGACLAAAGLVAWYSGTSRPSAARVLGLAIALRAIAFPLPPALSDDAYRYAWDGRVQGEGINPYLYEPDAPELAALRGGEEYARLNSAQYHSVYPPASQLAFRGGAAAGGWPAAYYVVKAVIAMADLLAVSLLLRLAAPAAVVLYAWNPLALIEIAGQGHTEGLAVLGIVLAAWAVARRRGAWAGAGLALAAGAKLFPILLVPAAWRRAGAAVPLAALAAGVAMALPYAAPGVVGNVAESLALYVRSFEFAAAPYLALKAAGAWLGLGDVSKTLGPALALAFAAGAAALLRRDRGSFAATTSALYGLFFVTATTVHPWYLVPALAMVPLLRRPGPWLWAAAFAPATYLFYTGPAPAYAAAVAIGWLGAVGLWAAPGLIAWALRRRARWKWRWIASALGEPVAGRSILDLGAAEGFVGACAAEAGARVTLADVADSNATDLPYVVYDGARLPMPDEHRDVVLLVFVLHHARDPDLLLAEAARVARDRVVIVETVPDESRRRRTELLDRMANRLRERSLRDDEPWLRMRSSIEWRRRIEDAGLGVLDERRRGGSVHPQVLFVTRPRRDRPTRTPDVAGTT